MRVYGGRRPPAGACAKGAFRLKHFASMIRVATRHALLPAAGAGLAAALAASGMNYLPVTLGLLLGALAVLGSVTGTGFYLFLLVASLPLSVNWEWEHTGAHLFVPSEALL